MENANKFRDKMRSGQTCVGIGVALADPIVTEVLSSPR